MQRPFLWSSRLLALTLLGFAGAVLVSPGTAQARQITKLRIDRATITKGYTVVHRDGAIRFAVTPDQVDQEVSVTIKDAAIYRTPLPEGKRAVSPFFTYDMLGLERNPIIVRRPSWIAVRFSTDNPGADKALYNWDDAKNAWVRMQSAVHPSGEVRGITVLPYSRVVVLEDVGTYQGAASW
ncbi:MAG: hypothetical protein HY341_01890, partial [Candidatus Kerfeldbacteria bacterium]|nr:hypothetical protein [Candidatus Kerfeldbacteria bacterium]